ncbi:hypothetical protein, partial [Roseobacter sp. HKCCA2468]|uniref:hypothetical protein n=1 Tax=Roseobacter sp. HKCCA2468 TaxID=3120342 RepID=UPI0030EBED4A
VEGAVETGSGANMALINSALDTTAIASANVDTLEKVQALVDAAAKVVALAGDTAAPRLVAGDLTKLGVDLTSLASGNTKANAIALINDLLVADATAQTSVGDIQTKADALGALIDDVVQTTPAALAITTSDLEALGFNATSPSLLNGDGSAASTDITASNLQAIRLALSATADDLSDLASLSDLQTLVNDTAKAANKIENYAETASASTPTSAALIPDVADFEAIGATGVTTANLDFVLSALADDDVLSSITEINADIQGLVDVVLKLEHLADGVDNVLEEGDSATTGFEATSAKLTAAELQALGINLVTDTDTQSAQVAMLGDFLDLADAQSLADIASIQTQADAIADVLANMALDSTVAHSYTTTDGSDGDGVSMASLQALGFTQVS